MLRRLGIICLAIGSFALTAATLAAQPEQLNQYKPVTGPPPETIPAAPLVIAAYIIVWLGLMGYLWSIWRRLGKVEAEMQALQKRTRGSVH